MAHRNKLFGNVTAGVVGHIMSHAAAKGPMAECTRAFPLEVAFTRAQLFPMSWLRDIATHVSIPRVLYGRQRLVVEFLLPRRTM